MMVDLSSLVDGSHMAMVIKTNFSLVTDPPSATALPLPTLHLLLLLFYTKQAMHHHE